MSKCLRCHKEFECGTILTCQECIDKIHQKIKEQIEQHRKQREIADRFEIMDL